jgi:hypothetical protein
MTDNEFNEKYKQYIPEQWYGLGFDIPEVTEMLDIEISEIIKLYPKFEIHQIKLKFGSARFYTNINELANTNFEMIIEGKINELVRDYYKKKSNEL